jgi:hypothetical protein
MKTYIIVRCAGWESPSDLEKSAGISARVVQSEMKDQVRWLRSYVTDHDDSRLGTVCIYEAASIEAIREHARRSGIPITDIYPVRTTVVINDDTPQAA